MICPTIQFTFFKVCTRESGRECSPCRCVQPLPFFDPPRKARPLETHKSVQSCSPFYFFASAQPNHLCPFLHFSGFFSRPLPFIMSSELLICSCSCSIWLMSLSNSWTKQRSSLWGKYPYFLVTQKGREKSTKTDSWPHWIFLPLSFSPTTDPSCTQETSRLCWFRQSSQPSSSQVCKKGFPVYLHGCRYVICMDFREIGEGVCV